MKDATDTTTVAGAAHFGPEDHPGIREREYGACEILPKSSCSGSKWG